MLALGDRIRGLESMGPMGKVAVIAVADEAYQQARLFETLVVAHRPLKIFRDAEAAYEWLKVEPPADVELAGTGLSARPEGRGASRLNAARVSPLPLIG